MKKPKIQNKFRIASLGRWSASLLVAAGMQTLLLPSLHAASSKPVSYTHLTEITPASIVSGMVNGANARPNAMALA